MQIVRDTAVLLYSRVPRHQQQQTFTDNRQAANSRADVPYLVVVMMRCWVTKRSNLSLCEVYPHMSCADSHKRAQLGSLCAKSQNVFPTPSQVKEMDKHLFSGGGELVTSYLGFVFKRTTKMPPRPRRVYTTTCYDTHIQTHALRRLDAGYGGLAAPGTPLEPLTSLGER